MLSLLAITARNFRSLKDVNVRLGPVNVLVGPNAAGKSNLLDIIQFLGDSARSDLVPALDKRGGYERVRFRGPAPGPINLEVEAMVTSHSSWNAPDVYDLWISTGRVRESDRRVLIRRESFKFKRTAGRGRRITVQGGLIRFIDQKAQGDQTTKELGVRSDSLALAALPRLSEREGGAEIRRIADLFESFRVFDVNVEAARQPSTLMAQPSLLDTAEVALEADASNLAAFLFQLQRNDREAFNRLQEDASRVVPGLSALRFRTLGGSGPGVAIELEEQGLRDATFLGEASYGTIRALALLALLYDPNPPLLTCIEEFDHGLHPYAFDLLVERLREASERTQFLIATHSPALVNRLRASELIVCERDDSGASNIPAIEPQDVERLEQQVGGELGLGEIWFTGTLGGVPR